MWEFRGMTISVRNLWVVGFAVWANCGVGGCGLGGLQCGGFVEELWWDAVGVCGGCSIAVAVGGCGVGRLRCEEDAMGRCCCGGKQGVGEF